MSDGTRTWLGRLLTVLGSWVAVSVVLSLFGARPAYGLVLLTIATVALLAFLFLDVSARQTPSVWSVPREETVVPPGEDPRFSHLRRVVGRHLDAREVTGDLHAELTRLAEDRLLIRHGVHLLADPERAAALLGPELTEITRATPPYPRLRPAAVERAVERIENL